MQSIQYLLLVFFIVFSCFNRVNKMYLWYCVFMFTGTNINLSLRYKWPLKTINPLEYSIIFLHIKMVSKLIIDRLLSSKWLLWAVRHCDNDDVPERFACLLRHLLSLFYLSCHQYIYSSVILQQREHRQRSKLDTRARASCRIISYQNLSYKMEV